MPAKRKPKGMPVGIKPDPVFRPNAHILSDDARKALATALGADKEYFERVPHALACIEYVLGAYPNEKAWLDHAPRPAEQAKALQSIEASVRELRNEIAGLDAGADERLEFELSTPVERASFKPPDFLSQPRPLAPYMKSLAILARACSAAARSLEAIPSKGAPPKAALGAVVEQLRRIFDANAQGWSRKRTKRGASDPLSDYEKKELEFVAAALDDAGILKRVEAGTAKLRRLCAKSLPRP